MREAGERGVAFQCGFQLRTSGIMQAIQAAIDNGEIGRPSAAGLTQISGSHRGAGYMSKARAGGIFYEKLCHQVDLFRMLFGEPLRVFATAAPNVIAGYEIADNVMCVMQFPGGEQGTIKFDTRRAIQVDGTVTPAREVEGREWGHFYEWAVTGESGTAVYDGWTQMIDIVRLNDGPEKSARLVRRVDPQKEYGGAAYHIDPQDHEFYRRVAAGRQPLYPASDALLTMRWVERAEESIRLGGEWVS